MRELPTAVTGQASPGKEEKKVAPSRELGLAVRPPSVNDAGELFPPSRRAGVEQAESDAASE